MGTRGGGLIPSTLHLYIVIVLPLFCFLPLVLHVSSFHPLHLSLSLFPSPHFACPQVLSVALPGGAGRRLGRHVGLSRAQDVAACWWPAPNEEEARPWSPLPSEADRANLVLLSCSDPAGLKVRPRLGSKRDRSDTEGWGGVGGGSWVMKVNQEHRAGAEGLIRPDCKHTLVS